jgi:hypothetical protein
MHFVAEKQCNLSLDGPHSASTSSQKHGRGFRLGPIVDILLAERALEQRKGRESSRQAWAACACCQFVAGAAEQKGLCDDGLPKASIVPEELGIRLSCDQATLRSRSKPSLYNAMLAHENRVKGTPASRSKLTGPMIRSDLDRAT